MVHGASVGGETEAGAETPQICWQSASPRLIPCVIPALVMGDATFVSQS